MLVLESMLSCLLFVMLSTTHSCSDKATCKSVRSVVCYNLFMAFLKLETMWMLQILNIRKFYETTLQAVSCDVCYWFITSQSTAAFHLSISKADIPGICWPVNVLFSYRMIIKHVTWAGGYECRIVLDNLVCRRMSNCAGTQKFEVIIEMLVQVILISIWRWSFFFSFCEGMFTSMETCQVTLKISVTVVYFYLS